MIAEAPRRAEERALQQAKNPHGLKPARTPCKFS